MPRGVKTPPERIDAILEMLDKGVAYRTICSALGTSQAVISRFSAAAKDAQAHSVPSDRARELPKDVLERVYSHYGIELSPTVPDEPKKGTTAEPKKGTTADDNTAAAVVKLLGAITEMTEAVKTMTAAINQIDNRLSTMQMTQAGLRGDFGKEAQRIIEAIHVEGDIISKDQQKMIEHLDKIGHNTKRRPWQGEGATA